MATAAVYTLTITASPWSVDAGYTYSTVIASIDDPDVISCWYDIDDPQNLDWVVESLTAEEIDTYKSGIRTEDIEYTVELTKHTGSVVETVATSSFWLSKLVSVLLR